MSLSKKIANAAQFVSRYGNPLSILLARNFNGKGFTTVRDRATGVEAYCTVQSYRMFGEVWHDRDYEVPRVPLRPGDLALDIGGNQGFYACYAARHGASVHTFEPFPDSFGRLKGNVERNGFAHLVTAHQAAVSADDGECDLVTTEQLGGGMNSIVKDFAKTQGHSESGRVRVKTISINTFFQQLPEPRVRLVKLDCEGAEWDILKALSPANVERCDAFAIEFHPGYELRDLVRMLLAWPNHHMAFAESLYCEKNIIRMVHKRVFGEI